MPARTTRPIRSADDWAHVAATELHWYHALHNAWLTKVEPSGCAGWAESGTPLHINDEWRPWHAVVDASEAPIFVRWFCGGMLNAAFNELDRQVLRRCGRCKRGCTCSAFVAEGSSDAPARLLTRIALLERSTYAASALRTLLQQRQRRRGDCWAADCSAADRSTADCSPADCSAPHSTRTHSNSPSRPDVPSRLQSVAPPRVTLYLPNGPSAAVWVSACKRFGVPDLIFQMTF